jgi:hypothetical protein
MSNGYDLEVTVHLHDGSHSAALAAGDRAVRALIDAGFLVTRGATLPHMPLTSPSEFRRFMEEADMPEDEPTTCALTGSSSSR